MTIRTLDGRIDPRFLTRARNEGIMRLIAGGADAPTQSEIARKLGISRQRVSQIVRRHRARVARS